MSKRLKEEDVHLACVEISTQGERPTALNLLDKLGRGSLTTISKYLTSWNKTDDALAIEAESLPTTVQLPEELSTNGEDLLKKMWSTAKGIADQELDIQREALKQAEATNQLKVEEAFKFSEAQAIKIERLEEDVISIKEQLNKEFKAHGKTTELLNEAEKDKVGLSKDNNQAQQKIEVLTEQVSSLVSEKVTASEEKKLLEKEHFELMANKDNEIRSLDILAHTNQSSLEALIKTNNELTLEITGKSSKLDDCIIEIEITKEKYKTVSSLLEDSSNELAISHKLMMDSEKRTAKLEGQLSVYEKIKPAKK